MNVNLEASFRSDHFDAMVTSFAPGKEVAEAIASGLKAVGLQPEGVVDEEPFWCIRISCDHGPEEVFVYLYLPDQERGNAIWALFLKPRVGFLGRLLGRQEEPGRVKLVAAIHSVLQADTRLRDVRWFSDLPSDPYAPAVEFSNRPVQTG